jgi:hypothetical protein
MENKPADVSIAQSSMNPLIGPNLSFLGPRFPPMSNGEIASPFLVHPLYRLN